MIVRQADAIEILFSMLLSWFNSNTRNNMDNTRKSACECTKSYSMRAKIGNRLYLPNDNVDLINFSFLSLFTCFLELRCVLFVVRYLVFCFQTNKSINFFSFSFYEIFSSVMYFSCSAYFDTYINTNKTIF